ncbi:MAG: thioredoxin fold domain-containing protein [Acidithiobacillus sp.]|nr:thioredoxin fold domain-containing protein [Acidithiobacillus sp.]
MNYTVENPLPWCGLRPKPRLGRKTRNLWQRCLLLLGLALLALLPASPAWAQSPEDESFWHALTHTHFIEEGKKGPVVYLFLDPNCPYCHQVYTWLQNPVREGKIRLRVVVVGFLSPTSLPKAAAILAAKDPLQTLKENEEGFAIRDGLPSGGIAPASPAVVQKEAGILRRNLLFLQGKESLLANVPPNEVTVPLLVYRVAGKTHYLPTLPDLQQWKEIVGTG